MQGPILFTSRLFLRKLWECEFHQSEWGNQERWHGIREEGRTKEEEEESRERETQLHSRPWEQPQLQELREGLQKGCLKDRSRKKLRCAWNYGKDVYSAGGEFGDRLTIQRKLSKWKKTQAVIICKENKKHITWLICAHKCQFNQNFSHTYGDENSAVEKRNAGKERV